MELGRFLQAQGDILKTLTDKKLKIILNEKVNFLYAHFS
jgi:hypothetical protein